MSVQNPHVDAKPTCDSSRFASFFGKRILNLWPVHDFTGIQAYLPLHLHAQLVIGSSDSDVLDGS